MPFPFVNSRRLPSLLTDDDDKRKKRRKSNAPTMDVSELLLNRRPGEMSASNLLPALSSAPNGLPSPRPVLQPDALVARPVQLADPLNDIGIPNTKGAKTVGSNLAGNAVPEQGGLANFLTQPGVQNFLGTLAAAIGGEGSVGAALGNFAVARTQAQQGEFFRNQVENDKVDLGNPQLAGISPATIADIMAQHGATRGMDLTEEEIVNRRDAALAAQRLDEKRLGMASSQFDRQLAQEEDLTVKRITSDETIAGIHATTATADRRSREQMNIDDNAMQRYGIDTNAQMERLRIETTIELAEMDNQAGVGEIPGPIRSAIMDEVVALMVDSGDTEMARILRETRNTMTGEVSHSQLRLRLPPAQDATFSAIYAAYMNSFTLQGRDPSYITDRLNGVAPLILSTKTDDELRAMEAANLLTPGQLVIDRDEAGNTVFATYRSPN